MTRSTRLLPEYALLVVLSSLWGASYTLIRIGVATLPPISFIAGRTLIASLVLVAILRLRRIALPRDAALWGRFLVQACLNSAVPFTLIAWAERHIDAGIAAILNAGTPIFAFALTALVSRHEALTWRKLFGVIAGMVGVGLVLGVSLADGLGGDVLAEGAVLLATACYAGAAIYGKGFARLDPMVPAAGSLIMGTALLLPAGLLIDRPWTLVPSAASLLALVLLGVFSTAAAFVIYFRLIRTLGSVGATAQAYVRVPIGVGIGAAVLGEQLAATAWAGMALVTVAVAAMTWPARRRA